MAAPDDGAAALGAGLDESLVTGQFFYMNQELLTQV